MFSRLCVQAPNAENKKASCLQQLKKPTEWQRANELSTHYILWLLGCNRVRKIPHTNSLGQLDTHPARYPKKTGVCSLTATVLRTARFFWARSPPYVSATFAGCLQALPTKPRATLASKGAGIAGKANRGTMYRAIYT